MAKQRKGPPPPPKKQKGSIFPVNERGIRPQDYSTYTFNKQYAIPGLEALTEMYGDPGLGFLAGLLGTVGANIDNQLIPPTKAKQKGKSGKLTKAPDIAAAPDRGQSSSPPPESSAPRPGDYVPVPPRQSTPPRNAPNTDEELRDMLQQQSYRRATPAPEQSNFLNQLMQSLNNERAAQQQLSPLRSNLRYFVNPGNVPRAEYGGVPKYQNGQTATDGAQPKCPDGYQFDGKECVVITPGSATKQTPATHICPERYKWDEAQKTCVPFDKADNAKWLYTNINKTGQSLPGLGLIGQAGLNMAQAPGFKPDVGLGTMSGAMQGFAQGGILGAVGGGLMGMLSTGRDLDAYNTEADRLQRARVQNANVPGNLGYYAQFGGQTPGAVPSQTETGELVLFPDNTLPDVKATLRHKQMTDDEVTDMLPENSYVFSDDKDMKFDLKAMKDKVLGYGMSYYDEHSNYPTETMRFGDIMPESGKMTFANAARILRSKVPTMGNKKDIFDIATDADNLETRVPYLMELINLQDAKNASEGRTESTMGPQSEEPMGGPGEMPMMQAWGGAVPKFQNAGPVSSATDSVPFEVPEDDRGYPWEQVSPGVWREVIPQNDPGYGWEDLGYAFEEDSAQNAQQNNKADYETGEPGGYGQYADPKPKKKAASNFDDLFADIMNRLRTRELVRNNISRNFSVTDSYRPSVRNTMEVIPTIEDRLGIYPLGQLSTWSRDWISDPVTKKRFDEQVNSLGMQGANPSDIRDVALDNLDRAFVVNNSRRDDPTDKIADYFTYMADKLGGPIISGNEMKGIKNMAKSMEPFADVSNWIEPNSGTLGFHYPLAWTDSQKWTDKFGEDSPNYPNRWEKPDLTPVNTVPLIVTRDLFKNGAISSPGKAATVEHEATHGTGAYQDAMEKVISKMFPSGYHNKNFYDQDPYIKYLREDGLYTRVQALRKFIGKRPGQTITYKDLKRIMGRGDNIEQQYKDLFKFYDINTILKMLNTLADVSPEESNIRYAQFGGSMPGSMLTPLMETTYDKSLGSKFLGDKGKALIPVVTTALGVPAMKYGKKWTIIED